MIIPPTPIWSRQVVRDPAGQAQSVMQLQLAKPPVQPSGMGKQYSELSFSSAVRPRTHAVPSGQSQVPSAGTGSVTMLGASQRLSQPLALTGDSQPSAGSPLQSA